MSTDATSLAPVRGSTPPSNRVTGVIEGMRARGFPPVPGPARSGCASARLADLPALGAACIAGYERAIIVLAAPHGVAASRRGAFVSYLHSRFRLAVAAAVTLAGVGIALDASPATASPQPGSIKIVQNGGTRTLFFRAGNGTPNQVEVRHTPGQPNYTFDISDSGQAIYYADGPQGACVSLDPHVMRCSDILDAEFKLADGNDGFHNFTTLTTYVYGNDGDDTLQGDVGVFAGDHLYGENGKDWLQGGSGFDVVDGGADDDTVFGSFGNDVVLGGPGNDLVSGGSDDDWMVMDAGADDVYGDTGKDTLAYRFHNGVKVTLDERANDGAPGEKDNIHGSVEVIQGSPGDDTLIGNNQPNIFDGMEGNDSLRGEGGDDTLDAMAGTAQKVWGGAGAHDICVGYGLVVREQCEH